MTDVPPIHLFAVDSRSSVWARTPVAQSYQRQRPSADDLPAIARTGAALFIDAGRLSPADLSEFRAVADVTILVADATAGGRGSPDFVAALWERAPAVAALLHEDLLTAGGVAFSERAADQLKSVSPLPGDPLTVAVAEILARGGTMQAVVLPAAIQAAAPSNPPELTPSPRPDQKGIADLIARFDETRLLSKVRSKPDAAAVRAGMLLWHSFLDDSHAVSQEIEGEGLRRAGDHWHAIMHRREPDYSNAKYWFRRVGRSPIFETLAARTDAAVRDAGDRGRWLAGRVAPGGRWDPMAFVDACEEAASRGNTETDLLLRRIQADEMLLLLTSTCDDAST